MDYLSSRFELDTLSQNKAALKPEMRVNEGERLC